jgi:hypothetical protein
MSSQQVENAANVMQKLRDADKENIPPRPVLRRQNAMTPEELESIRHGSLNVSSDDETPLVTRKRKRTHSASIDITNDDSDVSSDGSDELTDDGFIASEDEVSDDEWWSDIPVTEQVRRIDAWRTQATFNCPHCREFIQLSK